MTIRWLRTAQAAEHLGLKHSQVLRLIQAGKLPGVKAGTGKTSPYRVTEQAVADYARQRAS